LQLGIDQGFQEVFNDKAKYLINAYKILNPSSLPHDERETNVLFKKIQEHNKCNERLSNSD